MALLRSVIELVRRAKATVWLPWLLACVGWGVAERYVPVPTDQTGSFAAVLAGVDWGMLLVLALIPLSSVRDYPFVVGWLLKVVSIGLVLLSAMNAIAGALPGSTILFVHVRQAVEPVAIAPFGAIVGFVIGLLGRDVFATRPLEANPLVLLEHIVTPVVREQARRANAAENQVQCQKLHDAIVALAETQLRAELARDLHPELPVSNVAPVVSAASSISSLSDPKTSPS
jgi:signal transduction histidine kinase